MALASFPAAGVPRGSLPGLNSRSPTERSLPRLRNFPGRRRRRSAAGPTPAATCCAQTPGGGGKGDGQPLESVRNLVAAAKDVQQVSDLASGFANSTSAEDGRERQPLETVLKLYTIVKDGNVPFLGHGEDGKKREVNLVMQLFSSLIGLLGNNVEFVIKPTRHEGTDLGVAWRLEWKKAHKHTRGGYGFNTVHYYQGKMFLRNVEKFVEPIVHIHSAALDCVNKLVECQKSALDQITAFKENRKAAFVSSLVLLLLMSFCFMMIKKLPH